MGCGASKKVLPELGEADLRGLTQEQKAAVYACPNTPRSVKTQIIKTRSERSGVLSESDCDFDLAGEEILQEAQQALENGDKQTYKPLNVIWSHPDSGGRLFVSNAHAASSRDVLREHGIRFIVNCLDFNGELGAFHNDPHVSYLYFPIGCWREAAPEKTPRSVARVLAPMLGFVGRNLEEGSNVMIHCLAGCHRAGASGVACLMQFCNLDHVSATTAAKASRPSIDPISHLQSLLRKFESAKRSGLLPAALENAAKVGFQKEVNAVFDIKPAEGKVA